MLGNLQMFLDQRPHRRILSVWLLRCALGEASPISFNVSEIDHAIECGFAPWLIRALEAQGQNYIKAENQEVLKLAARAAALQARNLHRRLAHILQYAAQRDISVCLLKGAALEPWLYPGPGFRPMADVDVLVEPALQQRFERLLAEEGYVQRSGLLREFYVDHHHSMPFWHPQQGTWIEVHTRLYPDVANLLLAEQECFNYQGTKARRLCASAHLLYTVAHWADPFPGPKGLVALLDLALLLRHTGPPDLECYDFDRQQRAWMRRALGVACSLLPTSSIPMNFTPALDPERWRRRRLQRLGERYILNDEPFGRWRSPTMVAYRWKALMNTPISTLALLREPWWVACPPRAEGRFSPHTLFSRLRRLWRPRDQL